jgi:hypothetical protein
MWWTGNCARSGDERVGAWFPSPWRNADLTETDLETKSLRDRIEARNSDHEGVINNLWDSLSIPGVAASEESLSTVP